MPMGPPAGFPSQEATRLVGALMCGSAGVTGAGAAAQVVLDADRRRNRSAVDVLSHLAHTIRELVVSVRPRTQKRRDSRDKQPFPSSFRCHRVLRPEVGVPRPQRFTCLQVRRTQLQPYATGTLPAPPIMSTLKSDLRSSSHSARHFHAELSTRRARDAETGSPMTAPVAPVASNTGQTSAQREPSRSENWIMSGRSDHADGLIQLYPYPCCILKPHVVPGHPSLAHPRVLVPSTVRPRAKPV